MVKSSALTDPGRSSAILTGWDFFGLFASAAGSDARSTPGNKGYF
jgi:hypothetical protein